MVLDADLKFQLDPADLYDQFEHFSDSNLIGCANDLSPHYYQMLQNIGYYDRHIDTDLGQPGPHQVLL